MEKIEIAKVLFKKYSDCNKITKTDDGIILDEQMAISENNFMQLMNEFLCIVENNSTKT